MEMTCAELADGELFELREQDDALVLQLRGDFGSLGWNAWSAELQRAVRTALRTTQWSRLVIDLSAVRYAGAAFVGFLISLSNRLKARAGSLILAQAEPPVAGLLRVANLDRALPSHSSFDAAEEAQNAASDE